MGEKVKSAAKKPLAQTTAPRKTNIAPQSTYTPAQEEDLSHRHDAAGNMAVQRALHSPIIQHKMTVNQPNDRYELEADRVAERVMRAGHLVQQDKPTTPSIEQKPLASSISPYRGSATSSATEATPKQMKDINFLRGQGEPLPASARAFFEQRFGADFSAIRIHTGPRANASVESFGARAITVGNDIMFGAGEFAPETDEGKRLIAHELTHAIQQGLNSEKANDPQVMNQRLEAINMLSANQNQIQRKNIEEEPLTYQLRHYLYYSNLNESIRIVLRLNDSEKDYVLSSQIHKQRATREFDDTEFDDEDVAKLITAFVKSGYRNLWGLLDWMLTEFDENSHWWEIKWIVGLHSQAQRRVLFDDDRKNENSQNMKYRFSVLYGDKEIYELMKLFMVGINLKKSLEWMFSEADARRRELKPYRVKDILDAHNDKERRRIGTDQEMKNSFFKHLTIQGIGQIVPSLNLPLGVQIDWIYEKEKKARHGRGLYFSYASRAITEIAALIEKASPAEIFAAKAAYRIIHGQKLSAAIIKNADGKDKPPTDLVRAVYFLHSKTKSSHTLEFGIALLAGNPDKNDRENEIYQILERAFSTLEQRIELKKDYEAIFYDNGMTEYKLIKKLKRRFTYDADKKMLALFHHKLTEADELVYHITGDKNKEKAVAIFTGLFEGEGFKGIRQLEMDWNEYILTPLEYPDGSTVGYRFHDKPLFEAVKSTFGRSSVWDIIQPIHENYMKWKTQAISQDDATGEKADKTLEEKLMIDAAVKVLENATYEDTRFPAYNYTYNDLKNNDDSILKAVTVLSKYLPAKINSAKGEEKEKLKELQTKIEKQIDAHYKYADNKKHMLAAKLTLYRDASTTSIDPQAAKEQQQAAKEQQPESKSDHFYAKIKGKDKKGAFEIAKEIWAADKVEAFVNALADPRYNASGDKIKEAIPSHFSFIYDNISYGYVHRIYSLLITGNKFDQARRGGTWLYSEVINQKKPDLSLLQQFISLAEEKNVLDACITGFFTYQAGGQGNNRKNREKLLDIIERKRFTKKEKVLIGDFKRGFKKVEQEKRTKINTDFLRLKDMLVPPSTIDEAINRLETYIKHQGVEKDNVQGVLTYRILDRLRYMKDPDELKALLEATGRESWKNLAKVESDIAKDRADKYRRDKDAEAAWFAFIAELIVVAIVLLAVPGAGGVILAGLLSKAAGMGVKEAMLGDRYDLISDDNFKALLTGAAQDLATLGIGSKWKSIQKLESFQKLGSGKKAVAYLAKNAADQATSVAIDSVINQKRPQWEDELLKLGLSMPFEEFKRRFESNLANSSNSIKGMFPEFLLDTASSVTQEIAVASANERDFDYQSIIAGAQRNFLMQFRSTYQSQSGDGQENLDEANVDEGKSRPDQAPEKSDSSLPSQARDVAEVSDEGGKQLAPSAQLSEQKPKIETKIEDKNTAQDDEGKSRPDKTPEKSDSSLPSQARDVAEVSDEGGKQLAPNAQPPEQKPKLKTKIEDKSSAQDDDKSESIKQRPEHSKKKEDKEPPESSRSYRKIDTPEGPVYQMDDPGRKVTRPSKPIEKPDIQPQGPTEPQPRPTPGSQGKLEAANDNKPPTPQENEQLLQRAKVVGGEDITYRGRWQDVDPTLPDTHERTRTVASGGSHKPPESEGKKSITSPESQLGTVIPRQIEGSDKTSGKTGGDKRRPSSKPESSITEETNINAKINNAEAAVRQAEEEKTYFEEQAKFAKTKAANAKGKERESALKEAEEAESLARLAKEFNENAVQTLAALRKRKSDLPYKTEIEALDEKRKQVEPNIERLKRVIEEREKRRLKLKTEADTHKLSRKNITREEGQKKIDELLPDLTSEEIDNISWARKKTGKKKISEREILAKVFDKKAQEVEEKLTQNRAELEPYTNEYKKVSDRIGHLERVIKADLWRIDEIPNIPDKQGLVKAIIAYGDKVLAVKSKRKFSFLDLAHENPDYLAAVWNDFKNAKTETQKRGFYSYLINHQRTRVKAHYGEMTEAFRRGKHEITVIAPKGFEKVNEEGIDIMTYDSSTDRIKLIDNKAYQSGSTIDEVSALEWNLPKNLDDAIAEIEGYINPREIPNQNASDIIPSSEQNLREIGDKVLPKLKQARAELQNYINTLQQNYPGIEIKELLKRTSVQIRIGELLERNNIDRIVTTRAGGENVTLHQDQVETGFRLE